MESKTTLVEVFGGPKRIVQQVLSHPKTITVCPLCKTRFKAGDSTILVDLVKTIGLTQKDRGDLEFTARIHLCDRCAEPIIRQKREAVDQFVSFLAELAAEEVLKELEQEARADASEKKSKTRGGKPRSR
jgi:hypothetical protein